MKHTKGEWIGKESEVYSQETGKTIARCDIGGRDEETEANARLMAAAPDLLRALMMIIDNTDHETLIGLIDDYNPEDNNGFGKSIVNQMTDAITKATQL